MIFINKSFKDNILSKVHKLSSIPIELSLLIDDGFIVHNNDCVFLKAKQPLDVDNGNFLIKQKKSIFITN